MSLPKDLSELVGANIITDKTALEITAYYKQKQLSSPNRQLLLFGILGALLVGIGVMFIIANQWDALPLSVKTTCAFLLLVVPQLLCGYVLLNKQDKIVWRESTALLLFFAVGANISLVSQIYHINGEPAIFFLTWILLTGPLIYLLNSSAVSVAYLFLSMMYCLSARFNATFPYEDSIFWLLVLLPLPHYLRLIRQSPDNFLSVLHHWMIPYVLTQTFFTLGLHAKVLLHPGYMLLFAVFCYIGSLPFLKNRPLQHNGYLVFGFAGTIISLLVMTFQSPWKKMTAQTLSFSELLLTTEFAACLVLFALAAYLLYLKNKENPLFEWQLTDVAWMLYIPVFILGVWATTLSVILMNLLVFVFGLLMLRDGSRKSHLGVLNTGMLVIALLAVCRSFDTEITFAVKGIMFVLVGIGFFATNWLIIKKRKENEA